MKLRELVKKVERLELRLNLLVEALANNDIDLSIDEKNPPVNRRTFGG